MRHKCLRIEASSKILRHKFLRFCFLIWMLFSSSDFCVIKNLSTDHVFKVFNFFTRERWKRLSYLGSRNLNFLAWLKGINFWGTNFCDFGPKSKKLVPQMFPNSSNRKNKFRKISLFFFNNIFDILDHL